jgi:hypothetical protein
LAQQTLEARLLVIFLSGDWTSALLRSVQQAQILNWGARQLFPLVGEVRKSAAAPRLSVLVHQSLWLLELVQQVAA